VTPVSAAETIASLMPNAELVVFEHSGHSPQMEEAERFQAVMREFLARVFPELPGLGPDEQALAPAAGS
jgi:proline iminopeptidase